MLSLLIVCCYDLTMTIYIIILTYKFSSKQAPVVEFEPSKSDGIPLSFICTEKKWCGSTSWVLLVIFGSLWRSAWGCSGWPLAPTEKKMGWDVVKDLPYKTLSPVFYTRDSYRVDFLRFYRLEESILFFFRNKHLNVLSQMMNSSWWLSNLSPSLCAGGRGDLMFPFWNKLNGLEATASPCLLWTRAFLIFTPWLTYSSSANGTIVERLPGTFPAHLLFIKLAETHSEVKKQNHLCLCYPRGINWCYNFSSWIVM